MVSIVIAEGLGFNGVIRGGLAASCLLACVTLAWWLQDITSLSSSEQPGSGVMYTNPIGPSTEKDLGTVPQHSAGFPTSLAPSSGLPADDSWERFKRIRIHRNLVRQGVSAADLKDLPQQSQMVHPDILERFAKVRYWWPELNKASSSVLENPAGRPTLLSIDTLDGDSILWELGLRERDVILLINGDITQFDPVYAASYVREAQRTFASLARGEPVSVTVLRNGRPLELLYEYW